MDKVCLVVPCYNEAERLDSEAFLSAVREIDGLHLLFVDDGSTDATPDVLRRLMERLPAGRGRLLPLERNVGKAEAVRRGILGAFADAPADLLAVGYWDADLSTPLAAVSDLAGALRAAEATSVVLGSRVKLLGRQIDRRAIRHYSGRVFATLASLALRLPVYDTQCGAKLFRASPETREVFEPPFVTRWAFDVELLARLARRYGQDIGVRKVVVEYPLREWTDVPGSKVRVRDLPRMIRDVGVVYLRYGRRVD